MTPRTVVRVRLRGRVQGVWFRAWTVREANRRGVAGWVRNCADGSVEAVFAGPAGAVDGMLEACRQGPEAARVDEIVVEPTDDPEEGGFRQLPTA